MILRTVLDFVVPILWLALALGVAAYFWVVWRRDGLFASLRQLLSYRLLWPLLGVLVVTYVSAALVFIDPKEVGVVISIFEQRGIKEEPYRAGLHTIIPLAEQVVRYPVVTQSYTMSYRPYEGAELGDDAIRARTADGQVVIIDITTLYRIDVGYVIKLHIDWQDRYQRDFIRPGLRAFVRSQAAKFTVDEINSEKRKAFEDALNKLTQDLCKGSGIDPVAVLVRNITFSPDYGQSVEDKMTALQRVTEAAYKAKQIANLANGEAEKIRIEARANADRVVIEAEAAATAKVVKAQAEAEALNLIGAALNDRDNLLTYRYIDKLSPNIKAMLLPSNAPLILPMPQLEDRPAAAAQAASMTPEVQAMPLPAPMPMPPRAPATPAPNLVEQAAETAPLVHKASTAPATLQ